ncbi:Uncharacterized protein GBIM_11969 [Gryllus bimaculatus]|nr:Uncharacterized protein GBIM_11969 [Gryllus bimaculatus]
MMVIKSDLVNQVLGRNQKSLIFQLYDSRTRSGNCASSNLLEITRSGRGATSIGISFKREHLVLKESHGSLSYEIFPVSERICVSVVYSTPESIGDLKFNIMFSNGTKYEESKYTERQFGEWKMRIFKSSLGKMTNDKINLQLDVSGKGTILHSIFGCNPSGQKDITVMENDVNIPDPVMKLQDFKAYKYSKISPLVTYQGVNVVTVEINTDEVEGIGETEYYQLQYREDKNTFWTELQPHKLRDTVIATNISDLLPGVDYRMRVIYIDKDGNSYQQSKVPTTLFSTLCTVLKELSVQTSGTPVAVEVPKVSFKAVLQASTSSKQVAYGSDGGNVLAVANKGAPLHVSNLQVTKEDSRKLRVSWKPPKFTGGSLQNFVVKYKCIRLLACEETYYEDAKEISVPGNQNYVDLAVLRPHAQYFIEVAAISGIPGPYTSIEAATQDAAPVAAPEKSESPIVTSTNTTISVQWLPLKSCSFLNGYLVGYGYTLYSENRTILATGNTRNTHIAFDDLTPQASYFVHVHIRARNVLVNDYGEAVTVNTVTSEGVPEAPTSLFASARTSDSVTLEWGPPFVFNGILRSFLINVEQLDSANSSHCCVYSPLQEVPVKSEDGKYQHKVIDLMPASKYIIGVSAKTISIGPSAFITLSTSPERPELNRAPKLLDNNRVKLPLGEGFPGINGTYLLLVLLSNGNSTSLIWNSEVDKELCSLVPTSGFYIVEEYNAEVMQSTAEEEMEFLEVEIGQGKGPRNGTIGVLEDPILPSEFRVGLALVLDYNGAVSVGFVSAEAAQTDFEDEFA